MVSVTEGVLFIKLFAYVSCAFRASSSFQQQHEVMSLAQKIDALVNFGDVRELKFPEFRQIESKYVNPQLVLYYEPFGDGTAVVMQGGIRLEFKETPIDHLGEILAGC
jgi:hypothetical protein